MWPLLSPPSSSSSSSTRELNNTICSDAHQVQHLMKEPTQFPLLHVHGHFALQIHFQSFLSFFHFWIIFYLFRCKIYLNRERGIESFVYIKILYSNGWQFKICKNANCSKFRCTLINIVIHYSFDGLQMRRHLWNDCNIFVLQDIKI